MSDQYVDQELKCSDCGAAFTFSAKEQARHAELGFTNQPKRCVPCRAAKKRAMAARDGVPMSDSRGGSKEMHVTTCAECGGEARVPFKPRGDKPVYCSDCFGKR